MSARILAIGPFSEEIAGKLAFPAEYYAGTEHGATVLQQLFRCVFNFQSWALAACFEIDPWDYNQHKLDPYRIDQTVLWARFFDIDPEAGFDTWPFDVARDWESFLALRAAGFDFYFLQCN